MIAVKQSLSKEAENIYMGLALDMKFNKTLKKFQTKKLGICIALFMLLSLLSEEHYFGYVIVAWNILIYKLIIQVYTEILE